MLTIDIVTVDRRVVGPIQARSITVPGELGEMTILPGHAHLVSTLETGVVKYQDATGKVSAAALSSGFVEVGDDRVRVLADTLEMGHEIDLERARRAQSRAEDRLKEKDLTPESFKKHQLKLARSLARQKVVKGL